MSEALGIVHDMIDRLAPLHEAMERGLSAKEIERLYGELVSLADEIGDLEGEIEDLWGKITELEPDDDDEAAPERCEAGRSMMTDAAPKAARVYF
jgi:hypothetical protein